MELPLSITKLTLNEPVRKNIHPVKFIFQSFKTIELPVKSTFGNSRHALI